VCIGGLLRFLRSHRPLYAGKALSKRNPNPEVKLQPWHKWYDPHTSRSSAGAGMPTTTRGWATSWPPA